MTVEHSNAAKSAGALAVTNLLNGGAGDATGDVAIWTAGLAIKLCEMELSNPAIASEVNGVCTFDTIGQGVVAGSANPSNLSRAQFRNRADVTVFTAAFGISGADINGPSLAVNDGDIIEFVSMTYTLP